MYPFRLDSRGVVSIRVRHNMNRYIFGLPRTPRVWVPMSIVRDIEANKQKYWSWLTNINISQADTLLSFARDAFDYEARRGEQIDTKANWLQGGAFAALSLAVIVSKTAVDGLKSGPSRLVIETGVAVVIGVLFCSIIAVLWTIRVNRNWFPPNPELVLRPEILTDNETDLKRDLALHYIDNFSLNRRMDDNKARLLKRGQVLLFLAAFATTIVGFVRLLI
jgi:hypothetical protein